MSPNNFRRTDSSGRKRKFYIQIRRDLSGRKNCDGSIVLYILSLGIKSD